MKRRKRLIITRYKRYFLLKNAFCILSKLKLLAKLITKSIHSLKLASPSMRNVSRFNLFVISNKFYRRLLIQSINYQIHLNSIDMKYHFYVYIFTITMMFKDSS